MKEIADFRSMYALDLVVQGVTEYNSHPSLFVQSS